MSSTKTITSSRKNKTTPSSISNANHSQRKALSSKKVPSININRTSTININQRKQSQETLLTVNGAHTKQSSPNKMHSKLECKPRYSFTNETSPHSPKNLPTNTSSCGDNFRKNCFSSKIVTMSSNLKKNSNLFLQSPDDNTNNNNNDITPFNINSNNISVKLIDKSKNKKTNKTLHQPYLTEQLYIHHANSSDDDEHSCDSENNNEDSKGIMTISFRYPYR